MSSSPTNQTGYSKDWLYFLLFSAFVFLAGFASPFWLRVEKVDFFPHDGDSKDTASPVTVTSSTSTAMTSPISAAMTSTAATTNMTSNLTVTYSIGLWTLCVSSGSSYESTTWGPLHVLPFFDTKSAWFQSVRIIQCLSLVGVMTSAVFVNLASCWGPGETSRCLCTQVFAVISGLLGFAGSMTFVMLTGQALRSSQALWTAWSFSWGVFLNVAGAISTITAALGVFFVAASHANRVAAAEWDEEEDEDVERGGGGGGAGAGGEGGQAAGHQALPLTATSRPSNPAVGPSPFPPRQRFLPHACLYDADGQPYLADHNVWPECAPPYNHAPFPWPADADPAGQVPPQATELAHRHEGDQPDHGSPQTDESDRQNHPSLQTDESDRQNHSSLQTDQSDRLNHPSLQTDESDRQNHLSPQTDQSNRQNHPSLQADQSNRQNQVTPQNDQTDSDIRNQRGTQSNQSDLASQNRQTSQIDQLDLSPGNDQSAMAEQLCTESQNNQPRSANQLGTDPPSSHSSSESETEP